MWMNSVSQFRDGKLIILANIVMRHLFEVSGSYSYPIRVYLYVYIYDYVPPLLPLSPLYQLHFIVIIINHFFIAINSSICKFLNLLCLFVFILKAFSAANMKCHLTSCPIDASKLNKGNRVRIVSLLSCDTTLYSIVYYFHSNRMRFLLCSYDGSSIIFIFSVRNVR